MVLRWLKKGWKVIALPVKKMRAMTSAEVTLGSQADVLVSGTHDQMVQHLDLEQLASSNQVAGNPNIGIRWFRPTARMIVGQYDAGSTDGEDRPEYM